MHLRFHLVGAAGLAPLAAALLPSTAFAADYLSVEQAQKLMFPEADTFAVRELTLDVANLQKVQQLSGLPARSAHWVMTVAQRAGQPLGLVVVDNVIGKAELITYAVAIDPSGAVRQIEILAYRESHGGEVRLPAWRRQFTGKTLQSPLRVGEDIGNISGATLSCSHITDGVRRIVGVAQIARDAGWLG